LGRPHTAPIHKYVYSDRRRARLRPVRWVGSSRRDLKSFPKQVQRDVGQALYAAQCGEEYPTVKALKGYGGRGVLEIVAGYEGDAYRAVYTVNFKDAIYVLHAFRKKSKRGIATPQMDLDLIQRRLAAAERDHRERNEQDPQNPD
jgi:phage-related protein